MIDLYAKLTEPSLQPTGLFILRNFANGRSTGGVYEHYFSSSQNVAYEQLNADSCSAVRPIRNGVLYTDYNHLQPAVQVQRKIHRHNLSNHKSLKEYWEDFIRTRNQLQQLNHPVPPLTTSVCFSLWLGCLLPMPEGPNVQPVHQQPDTPSDQRH